MKDGKKEDKERVQKRAERERERKENKRERERGGFELALPRD